MSTVILDFGSGNTAKNDLSYIKRMLDELKAVDTGKHEIICKWQIFDKAGENIPLTCEAFSYAYNYAKELGYKTTASVFDYISLMYLLTFEPCFVKIANNRKLDKLIGMIPRKYPVYVSVGSWDECEQMKQYSDITPLFCVSKYPASLEDYERTFSNYGLRPAISDHTVGLELFNKYHPKIWECHYRLEDSTGLDAGLFAKLPRELREIL